MCWSKIIVILGSVIWSRALAVDSGWAALLRGVFSWVSCSDCKMHNVKMPVKNVRRSICAAVCLFCSFSSICQKPPYVFLIISFFSLLQLVWKLWKHFQISTLRQSTNHKATPERRSVFPCVKIILLAAAAETRSHWVVSPGSEELSYLR